MVLGTMRGRKQLAGPKFENLKVLPHHPQSRHVTTHVWIRSAVSGMSGLHLPNFLCSEMPRFCYHYDRSHCTQSAKVDVRSNCEPDAAQSRGACTMSREIPCMWKRRAGKAEQPVKFEIARGKGEMRRSEIEVVLPARTVI